MPTLPTVTVNDQQLSLLMETFSGSFGGPGQPATVGEAYKKWLIENLKNKVYSYKADQLTQQHNNSLAAALAELRAQLDSVVG